MNYCNADGGDYPPSTFKIDRYDFSAQDIRGLLLRLVRNDNEHSIDMFFRKRLSLLAFTSGFFRTGHHDTWIVPQAQIKPSSINGKGLIPDYLFAGDNSDGVTWWVVELKSPRYKLYKKSSSGRITQTQALQDSISQIEGYIDYCDRNQAYIRDNLGLSSFTRPNGILLYGREKELLECPGKQAKKASFNRDSKSLQIRTYDAFIRQIEYMVDLKSRVPTLDKQLISYFFNKEKNWYD